MVSQILTNILNKAESLNLLKGIRINETLHVNHTLYADDLFICGLASRKNARSIKMCLELYKTITGQRPNMSKSDLFFPTWVNSRIKKAIIEILDIKQKTFLFKYLGSLISPFRIPVDYFKALITKVESKLAHWKTMHLTMAGKVTLANATIMSIPLFGLSTYAIPESILESITKLIRRFIWSNTSNNTGVHLVGWSTVTSPKSEGGLGIKDLKIMKRALLSKLVFELLNQGDKTWVKFMLYKYGCLEIWKPNKSKKISWTCRGLITTARDIKGKITITNVHPNCSVWSDPWLFNVPINQMPTYVNVHNDISQLQVGDLLAHKHWDNDRLNAIFPNWLVHHISSISISYKIGNTEWKWMHNTKGKSLTAAIYDEFRLKDQSNLWSGCQKLWRLNVVPKIAIFL
ncbi:hypothetical protein J5N97_010224 [Dioscorea zingiberensis]|uniref:Uncharacterized protein n=1 Tax=Dioscorea zingiberensis TaxID=325984 RepID=A0A9D5CZT6_9LILI|nr:hypothetical protein J5N97_010224 [Dioscorea zingiberensis]